MVVRRVSAGTPSKPGARLKTIVALSSGEAELYSLTKGAAQTLGLMSLAMDFGISANGRLHTDASAALGIVQREGLGKLRHVNVQYLWIQDRIRGGELGACKVPGTQNPADMMMKHLPAADILRYSDDLCLALHDTRAEMAPNLSHVSGIDVDDNGVDEWGDGDNGGVVRTHTRPRYCLFTPLRVGGSPPVRALTAVRITTGRCCDNGDKFVRRDNWTTRSTAHLRLDRAWTGTTRFLKRSGE